MIICYTVPEIRHVTDVIRVFDFGLFSTFLLPSQPEKPKFINTEKKMSGYIIILHMCIKHCDHMMYGS